MIQQNQNQKRKNIIVRTQIQMLMNQTKLPIRKMKQRKLPTPHLWVFLLGCGPLVEDSSQPLDFESVQFYELQMYFMNFLIQYVWVDLGPVVRINYHKDISRLKMGFKHAFIMFYSSCCIILIMNFGQVILQLQQLECSF